MSGQIIPQSIDCNPLITNDFANILTPWIYEIECCYLHSQYYIGINKQA